MLSLERGAGRAPGINLEPPRDGVWVPGVIGALERGATVLVLRRESGA